MIGNTKSSDLSRQRCFNHAGREAAAQCPQCRRFFCRECVTEHEGRVICATCLIKLIDKANRPHRGLGAIITAGAGIAGIVVAWLMFQCLGQLLLELPTSFHEGNVWNP